MACALTQDFNLDCRDGVGGIKEVHVIELSNVTTITEASGVVTGITKATGKRFYKYTLIRETSNAEETITGNEQNGTIFYAQTVNVIFNKHDVNKRNEVKLLAQQHIIAVVVENNGSAWLYGKINGLSLNGGTISTGTAWGDRNGFTLPFTGQEINPAPQVDAATLLTLETPG